MKKFSILLVTLAVFTMAFQAHAEESRIGIGANYWLTIDDIDTDNIDENGLSFYASYQYWMGLIGIEADIEVLPDKFGEDAFAPQIFILAGSGVYAGAGIGIEYRDGSFAEEPFFALKAGINLELLPSIYLDIYGTYRFNDTADLDATLDDIDTDTVFLGTAVRMSF